MSKENYHKTRDQRLNIVEKIPDSARKRLAHILKDAAGALNESNLCRGYSAVNCFGEPVCPSSAEAVGYCPQGMVVRRNPELNPSELILTTQALHWATRVQTNGRYKTVFDYCDSGISSAEDLIGTLKLAASYFDSNLEQNEPGSAIQAANDNLTRYDKIDSANILAE